MGTGRQVRVGQHAKRAKRMSARKNAEAGEEVVARAASFAASEEGTTAVAEAEA